MQEGRRYAITLIKPGENEEYICPSVTTIGENYTNKAKPLMGWQKNEITNYLLDKLRYDYPSVVNLLKNKKKWEGKRKWDFISSMCRRHILRAKRITDDVSSRAKEIGGAAHDLIEKYINSKDKAAFLQKINEKFEKKEIDKPIFNSFSAFLVWEKENVAAWLETELVVFYHGRDFKAAGRFDAIATLKDGKNVMIDFKTAKAIYPEFIEQLGGYWILYDFCKNKKYKASIVDVGYERNYFIPIYRIDGGIILRIDKKTGRHQEKRYTQKQLELGGKIFSHGARVYAQREKMEQIQKKLKEKKAKAKEKLMKEKMKQKALKKAKLLSAQKKSKKVSEVKKNHGRKNKNS